MDGIIKAIELLKESHKPVSMFSTVEKCKMYNDAITLAISSLEAIQEQYKNETLYDQIDDFDLRIHLYGDAGNFAFVTMEDGRREMKDIKITVDRMLPLESFSSEKCTPELIGQKVTEYIRKNCMWKS